MSEPHDRRLEAPNAPTPLGPSATAGPSFRAEDAALLAELEDELVADRLFEALAGVSPATTGRGTRREGGLVAHIRGMDGGEASVARVLAGGDVRAELGPFVLRDDLRGLAPGYLHHLGVFLQRVADAHAHAPPTSRRGARRDARASADAPSTRSAETGGSSDPRAAARLDAQTRSIAAFIALYDERAYVGAYARRVVRDALPGVDIDAAALAIVAECVDALGKQARDGARALAPSAELAVAALSRVRVACRMSGADERTQASFARRAESARMSAVDEALAPLVDAIAEARVRDAPVRELVSIFARVHAAWVWSGRDDAVERFAVDGVLDFCWDIRRKQDLSGIGLLLAPCVPLYESLAHRIETDPAHHIGYASKCAQIFCFRSDAETQIEKELAFAERAVKLCSTHRNGRATVAHILCNRALSRLSAPLVGRSVIEAARRDLQRAEELWPSSTRIPAVRAKLVSHGVKDPKA